jgi:divalent metal cation (Fe/Co/Zn/Cd) transporter
VTAAHGVAEETQHAMLHAVPKLSTVIVHVDPVSADGRDYHADLAHHDQHPDPPAGAPTV